MTSLDNWLFRPHRVKKLRAKARHDDSARTLLTQELLMWAKDAIERERFETALGTAEEAVALNRLRAATPEATLALTESLTMLALVLCALERFGQAEPVAVESVALAESLRSQVIDKRVTSMVRTGNYLLAACAANAGTGSDGVGADGHTASESSPPSEPT